MVQSRFLNRMWIDAIPGANFGQDIFIKSTDILVARDDSSEQSCLSAGTMISQLPVFFGGGCFSFPFYFIFPPMLSVWMRQSVAVHDFEIILI